MEYKIEREDLKVKQDTSYENNKQKWDYYISDDNEFILYDEVTVKIDGNPVNLGSPTGVFDKMGNLIFTKHRLLDFWSHDPYADVSVLIEGEGIEAVIDYGLSNYHCSHCPLHSDQVVINGVYIGDSNVVVIDNEKS